jgi:amino acid transporter
MGTTDAKLERSLGPWMATAVVVGCTIGSGVFKKPVTVAGLVPNFGIAISAWVLLGVLVVCGGLAMAEVTTLLPRAGGNYIFLREAYGRLWGFLWGWVEFFIIRSASIAALATVFTESLHAMLRHPALGWSANGGPVLTTWAEKSITIVTILALAAVNARGVRWGGGLGLAVTVAKVASLLAIILLPLVFLGRGSPLVHPEYLTAAGDKPFELGMYGRALIAVLWAYHGWMNLGPVAEEIREPQRNIPRALLGGIGILMALYLGANFAYALVLSHGEIAATKGVPVATVFSERLLGPSGGALIAGAIALSVFGALNGNLLVGPRLLYAMAEDRLAPARLAAVHPTYRTPVAATAVLAIWSAALVAIVALLTEVKFLKADRDHFDVLTDFAMFGAVVFETMTVASIFAFRRSRPDAERPYRCVGYPVVPAFYVLCFLGVLASYFADERKYLEPFSALGVILAGAAVYSLFLRRAR